MRADSPYFLPYRFSRTILNCESCRARGIHIGLPATHHQMQIHPYRSEKDYRSPRVCVYNIHHKVRPLGMRQSYRRIAYNKCFEDKALTGRFPLWTLLSYSPENAHNLESRMSRAECLSAMVSLSTIAEQAAGIPTNTTPLFALVTAV